MSKRNARVLDFEEIDGSMLSLVGGKGANLAELSRIDGVAVPRGFCITTIVFQEIVSDNEVIRSLLKQLTRLKADDRKAISETSAKIRLVIEEMPIPEDLGEEIVRHWKKLGSEKAFAVRSSATAEDLPAASFAGQQDSFLNIIGEKAILKHISKCWASLYTERAIIYRLQNGFDHQKIYLSVIVQQMVFPDAAGIMFTADPVSGNRKTLSIDASFGLGEALVSGLVNADVYQVAGGKIIDKKISGKKMAIFATPGGGTEKQEMNPARRNTPALTDNQILSLDQLGRKIEAHFGRPQDIEWCTANDKFYIVQSRPITTLFPIPANNDQENHAYISVGHQQMMTDPIKPLGLSFFLMTTRAPMRTAGGRLFVDITQSLASPSGRNALIGVVGKSDPLIKGALETILNRKDFIKAVPEKKEEDGERNGVKAIAASVSQPPIENGADLVADLIKRSQTSIAELKKNIQTKSGSELFDFILEDIPQLKKLLAEPKSFAAIMAGMNASHWINEKMNEWLGEKNAADILAQSVPNNVTSEMGLALMDVADIIRPYPDVIGYLQHVQQGDFRDELQKFEGGAEARSVIQNYLDKYGMRCSGEIDITRTRWTENPAILVPMILSNIKNFAPGASKRKFEEGLQEALKKEQELLTRLKALPDGERKALEAKEKIDQIRNFSGFREYPKYGIVSRYWIYKQALLKEAARLVENGIIQEKEDIYYLSFEELFETVRSQKLDQQIISQRKEEYRFFEKLTPPRVITSDGEIITGKYNRDNIPAGAIVGLPVSSGVIEGRARVILNMEEADLEPGDILVTAFTDPSWTALFVCIKGLVTEVGGLMTHGAVIAREYGIAAVVGVEDATRLIKDKQKIRVNGTEGFVEILDENS